MTRIRPNRQLHSILASLFLVSLTATACDKPPWCGPCAKSGEIRDFFCSCFDPKAGPPPGSRPSKYVNSQCVCKLPAQHARAYFTTRPSMYGDTSIGALTVYALNCADITACPYVNDTQEFLTGTMRITTDEWRETTNLVQGGTSWSLIGRLLATTSEVEVPESGLMVASTSLNGLTLHSTDSKRLLFAATNQPQDCRAQCDPISPGCIASGLRSDLVTPMRTLYSRILGAVDGELPAASIVKMFGLDRDPCNRGNLTLIGGSLRNSGGPCILATHLPQLGTTVELSFPSTIQGRMTVSPAGSMHIAFVDAFTAPEVRIGNDLLDRDWGGSVKSLRADSTSAWVETSNGCVKIRLGP